MALKRVQEEDGLVWPPTGVLVLTTVDVRDSRDGQAFRRSVEKVVKALRRRWPNLEYLGFVEFTTGRGARSGGYRRIHMHLLLKGLEVADLAAVQAIARRVWEARTGAHRVTAEPINTLSGMIGYLALHHRKPDQAPPEWWSGKRTRSSRGYYHRPIGEIRAQVALAEADRRRLWTAMQELGSGADALLLESAVAIARAEAEALTWEVVEAFEHPLLGWQDRSGDHALRTREKLLRQRKIGEREQAVPPVAVLFALPDGRVAEDADPRRPVPPSSPGRVPQGLAHALPTALAAVERVGGPRHRVQP